MGQKAEKFPLFGDFYDFGRFLTGVLRKKSYNESIIKRRKVCTKNFSLN